MTGCISSPEGTVSVYVAAEPGSALDQLQVNLSSIHVRPAGSTAENETDVLQSDRFPENWVEVSMAPAEVEMTFQTQAASQPVFFGEGAAPVDAYDGVGILVEGASGEHRNGTPVAVSVADAVTDHRTNFSVDDTGETRLLLTLDLDESLARHEDEQRTWLFTPIVSGLDVAHVDDEEAGEERHTPGEPANLSASEPS